MRLKAVGKARLVGLAAKVMVLMLALLAVGCGGEVESESLRTTSLPICTGVQLSVDPVGPVTQGTSVTLTATNATCGASETAEYRFAYRPEGSAGAYTEIRTWGTAASTAWNTTSLASGKYSLIVYARAVGSGVSWQSFAYGNIQIGDVCNTFVSLTSSPPPPQSAGTTVTLTGNATCTGGTAEYRFLYQAPGSSAFTEIRTWGPASVDWDTTGLASGRYTILAYARAQGNASNWESYRYGTYTLGTTCNSVSLSANPASPQPAGTQVTLTGSAPCASPEYRFSYRLFGTAPWLQIRTWGSASTNWDTTGLASGLYQLLVEVRSIGNTGGAEATSVVSYQIGSVCNSVSLSAAPPSPAPVGTQVTLTGNATCTGGTPEYRFLYRLFGSPTYIEIRTWGPSSTNWDTSALASGNYEVWVYARAEGSTAPYESFAAIPYVLDAVGFSQLSGGLNYHTCGVVNSGGARCWGLNDEGQLGDGSNVDSNTPVAVSGLTGVSAAAAGGWHTCALLGDGTVRCWGLNDEGQLGDGTNNNSTTPVTVSGVSGATAIASGTLHSCALLSGGTVSCWGHNSYGQLGDDGVSWPASSSPVAVSGLSSASAITAGGWHTCALLSDGTVQCWGLNGDGQLGDQTLERKFAPVAVVGLNSVTHVSAGDSHTCVRRVDNAIRCWGDNTYGQLGNGTLNDSLSPVVVQGLGGLAITVASGFVASCARLTNGAVNCWGRNVEGELGDGTGTDSLTAVPVSGVSGASQITTGGLHSCALVSGGAARCWGYNFFGQLGDGANDDALSSVAVLPP